MKVDAYRCDKCKGFVEAEEATHGTIDFKGRVTARYKVDLCLGCAESYEPDVEPQPTSQRPRAFGSPGPKRAPARRPEEVAECLRVGKRMLAEGEPLAEVLAKFGIAPGTWAVWTQRARAASASLSASGS